MRSNLNCILSALSLNIFIIIMMSEREVVSMCLKESDNLRQLAICCMRHGVSPIKAIIIAVAEFSVIPPFKEECIIKR